MSASSSSCDCPLCNFSAPTRSLWLSHLRSVHNEDENFAVTCSINGCGASYSKCASFVSHLYRQHREAVVLGKSNHVCPSDLSTTEALHDEIESENYVSEGGIDEVTDLQHAVHQILETDCGHQRKKSALYILSLKEVHGLSEAAVDHVLKETEKIFTHTVGRIRAGVNERIARSGTDPNEIPELNLFLSSVEDPFQGLRSTFLQEKFYREQLNCIVSVVREYLLSGGGRSVQLS